MPTNPPDAKRGPSLTGLRGEIDRVDKELIALLNRRAEIALQIGQLKQKQGLEVWSPAREDEVISKTLATSQGPLPEETLRLIYRELMSGSRALQRTLRVACLGPLHSYSHLASVTKFGQAVEHVPVGSIAAVFEEVNRRHVQFGIVPLENSTDGRIADTLEMRKEVRREVRTVLAQAVLTGYLVVGLGITMTAGLNLLQPGTVAKMTTSPIGQVALVISASLYAVGLLMIRKITRIEP